MPKETAQSKIKGFILSRSESDPSFGQVAYKTDSFPLDRLGDGVNGVHLLRKDGSLSSTEYGGEVRRIFLKTASGDFYSVYVLTGSFTPVKLWKANESIRITGSDIENTDISPLSGAIVLDSVVEVGKPISYHKLDSKK